MTTARPRLRWASIRTPSDVRRLAPARIYYGATTCWWTASASDLCQCPDSGLPCDPRGGMLFEMSDAERFLAAAEQALARGDHPYGKYGLEAFMAAYHGNVVVGSPHASPLTPTCMRTWPEYEAVLDAAKEGARE